MMNPNILNKNPLMFFDRAVNAQRSQLLTVMADYDYQTPGTEKEGG